MSNLSPIAPDIARLIPLLSSSLPGEVVATVEAIGRKLSAAGCDWHDLAAAVTAEPGQHASAPDKPEEPTSRAMAESLAKVVDTLPSRRAKFVKTIANYLEIGRRITPKQAQYLADLYEKYIDA